MSIQDALESGSNAMQDAEAKADDIVDSFRSDLFASIDEIKNEGLIGGLEAETLKGEADVLATSFKASLYAFHTKLKDRCVELDIDDLLPAMRDGGPR